MDEDIIDGKDVKVCAIVAMTKDRVIGKDNDLPWHIPADLSRFKLLTSGHTVLMGRKCYESIPDKFRPLSNRENIVITSSRSDLIGKKGVKVWSHPLKYIYSVRDNKISCLSDKIWVIGGGQVYASTLPEWDELYLTLVHGDYEGDVFFPAFEDIFEVKAHEEFESYSFIHYVRKPGTKEKVEALES